MSILYYIKQKIFFFVLKRKKASIIRQSSFLSFDEIKTISLIYQDKSIIDNNKWDELISICNKLIQYGKQVNLFIYSDAISFPEDIQKFKPIIISKKDLNWFYIPRKDLQNNILNKNNDIIIDFTEISKLSTLFILTISNSKMKIGKDDEKFRSYFDFLIEWKDKETVSEFLNNIIHYLQILKKSTK